MKGALSPPPPPEAPELNFNLLLINDLKIDLTLGRTGGKGWLPPLLLGFSEVFFLDD